MVVVGDGSWHMQVGKGYQEVSEVPFVEADTARTYVEAGIELVDRHTVIVEESGRELVMGRGTDQVGPQFASGLLRLLMASDEEPGPVGEQSD